MQADLLAAAQYALSGGKTTYSPFLGAFLITLILCCVQYGLNKIMRLQFYYYALSFLPSSLVLACITDVHPTLEGGITVGFTWWALILVTIAYSVLVWLLRYLPHCIELRKGFVYNYLWPNLLTMVFCFLIIGTVGNTQDTLHNEYKTVQLIKEKKYDQVLHLAKQSLHSSRELTVLCAYALSCEQQLGQQLFEYPQYYCSEGLVLCPLDTMYAKRWPEEIYRYLGAAPGKGVNHVTSYLMLLKKAGKAKPVVADYLLCAHLLDKNLDKFVENLMEYYPLNDSLPKHYKEALVLYSRSRANPLVTLDAPSTVENYLDFQRYEKSFTNDTVRFNKTKDMFGNTYWWYYFYQNTKSID